jgi:hypothetical protein
MVSCALPFQAAAQTSPRPGSMTQGLPEADFLFGRPRGTLGIRGSLVMPNEDSDIFDFVQGLLTIDEGDFRGPGFAMDVGYSLTPRLDVVGGFELFGSSVRSEYRDYVDNNFLPIEQDTSLKQNTVYGSLRLLLIPRGRSVGQFAWIPSAVTPYVGAGGGATWWEFTQIGDFVDFQDLDVFSDSFQSSGVSPSAHAFGGVDVQIYKRLQLSFEGRYLWSSGTLGQDFIDFDPIDLSGFRVSAGIMLLF